MQELQYPDLFNAGVNIYGQQVPTQPDAAPPEWGIAGSLRNLSGHIKKITKGSENFADFSQYVTDAFAQLDSSTPESLKGKVKQLKKSAEGISKAAQKPTAVIVKKLSLKETALRVSQFLVGCCILAGVSSGTIPAFMLVGSYPLALTVGTTTHLMTAALGTAAVTYKGASLVFNAIKGSRSKTTVAEYDPNHDLKSLRGEINDFLVDQHDALQT